MVQKYLVPFFYKIPYNYILFNHIHYIMNIPELFSDEKVNLGRQVELDIAKALAIIFMIFLHTLMVVQGYNAGNGPWYLLPYHMAREFMTVVNDKIQGYL